VTGGMVEPGTDVMIGMPALPAGFQIMLDEDRIEDQHEEQVGYGPAPPYSHAASPHCGADYWHFGHNPNNSKA
jgi:hypothetical protein